MRRKGVGLVCLSLIAANVMAAEPEPAGDNILHQGRTMVRSVTERAARYVDSWFGDKPFEQGGRVSGSIGFKLLAREGEAPEKSLVFRAKLDLPNLKDKTYLFFGRQNENEEVSDQPDAFRRRELLLPDSANEDRTLFAGIGYALGELFDLRAGVRGGYKVYAQARYRKAWQLSERDRIDFGETFFWKPSNGVGSTTSLNYGHAWSPSIALRWQNAATITEKTDAFAWSSSVGAFKHYGKNRSASVETLVSGSTASGDGIAEYGLRAIWKQPIYRDWTLLEVSVGHFWPQGGDDDARRRWAFSLGVDAYF